MKFRRRPHQQVKQLIPIGGAILLILILLITIIPNGSERKIVKKFYTYEQQQEFWNSYALFHPDMKERFTREWYINQRNHIFVDHFDVDSYELHVGKSKKLKQWQMSADHEPLSNVYEVPITKTYQSQFGEFSILQNIYAVKDEREWYVLWDFHY